MQLAGCRQLTYNECSICTIAGKDQGINIRHKVTDMIDFIQDDDRLREDRKKAKKNKDKYVGMSSDAMGGYGGSGWKESSWQDNWPRGGSGGSYALIKGCNKEHMFGFLYS